MGFFVFQRVWWVILLIACIGFGLAYIFNINSAISFVLGGSISFFSTMLFGRIFFAANRETKGVSTSKKIVRTFYIGEAIKILTTIVLFILVFQWRELESLFLFLGFITAQLGCLIALFSSAKI